MYTNIVNEISDRRDYGKAIESSYRPDIKPYIADDKVEEEDDYICVTPFW